MRKLRFSFVNGTHAQLTYHELLGFFRQPGTVAGFTMAAVALFVFQPFPDLSALPLAEEVVFWGIVFPGAFLVYLATVIAMARYLGRGLTVIGHLCSSLACALWSPDLAVLLGMDPAATTYQDRLLVFGFALVWAVAIEFLMVTYLLPAYLRMLDGKVADLPAGVPVFADNAPPTNRPQVVLLGRNFALPDLLLVSAEEHYVHIHTIRGRQMLRGRISDIEAQLPDAWGLRIHRSHWVAARSVRALHKARDGWTLELSDGQTLPVARARREAVAEWVTRLQAG
jgi:hypothetical protein